MSNKVLAIIGFVIFMVVIVYELEEIKGRISPFQPSCSCPSTHVDLGPANAFLYSQYIQLAVANNMTMEIAAKDDPELKKKLLYHDFEANIMMRKSTAGYFDFRPLSKSFKEHFEYLRDRYKEEHPDDAFTID